MTRNDFLSLAWQSYPVLPKGVHFVGRIHEIRALDNQWEVALLREGKTTDRAFAKLFLKDAPDSAVSSLLVAGDLVGIADTGEIHLLAPSLGKLPARSLHLETLKLWQDYIYWVREFFRHQHFVEITTPNLVTCPGTEPSLDLFSTDFVHGSKKEKKYLPTSPELHLKKALALGAEKIFEIKTCFRNGEVTEHHQPEFTMIEWYRAYNSLQCIQQDVADLVMYLAEKLPSLKAPASFETATMAQLFAKHCGFELKADTTLAELKALAMKLNVDVSSATQIDDYFFLLFLEKIENSLDKNHLCFVDKYPPYQAALARLTEDGWGDRFEVYWQGLEIANAFHELNDPSVQKKRFAEDLAKKKALGKEEIPLDPEFMQCLEAGMPPSSGIALGLERLFMALTGIQQIADTRLFPMK